MQESMNRVTAREHFPKDVKNHEMTVLRNDGLYRHLLFKTPGTYNCAFNIITYPGALMIEGDMGCYVFKRTEDMFGFFSVDKGHLDGINPSYWAEKLVGVDKGGFTEFDEQSFGAEIMGYLIRFLRENRHQTSKTERRELWEAVVSEVIDSNCDRRGSEKLIAARDFLHNVEVCAGHCSKTIGFELYDVLDRDFNQFTYHFYWCCYAIYWAIGQYEAKQVAMAI